jgi:hypothetical protein
MAIIFRPNNRQRGRGIGRIFSSAFSFLKNFLFPKIVKAATSSTGKALAKEVGSSLARASVKSLSGESTLKEAGKEELAYGIKKIQAKLSKLDKVKKKAKVKRGRKIGAKSNFFD